MNWHQCNIENLESGCARLGLELTDGQFQALGRHLDLLEKWNRRLNLTAVTDRADMVAGHLLDSLAIAPFVQGSSLLDIGSGAGFPGLPLAIVRPDLAVTLLDSRGRRVEFLRHVSTALGLTNVKLVHDRVERYRPGAKFDTLVTRAVASIADTLKLTIHLREPGSRLLLMKGRYPADELAASAVPGRARVEPLEVPFLDAERHVVIIDQP